ncbi:flagella biosynthesis regulator Flk [Escherichia albertii NBRC 107761 = DSM 17582]|uniref:Div protein n=1 Tax=Escherichia albertii (strain TW07627) TaxID=502347 RepID=A0ABC9NQQ3_ESCAT|nr:flagella biosynthesis regulator Flk [Escherichia albertii]EDS92641.1 div protein [Escherichia albertii TW07627]EKG0287980.1 flagella biosynthesis regulator Flk [Escherichia albertii]MCJ2197732.1 flagella biosynthesis regulator Flk [Escherichia albertii NBRC 107761 = DSM 17582]MCZ8795794.1 flagella biosynthesis regulator Flk [Escherichia albertii]GAL52795.1 flagellar regulator Flk [Escherichia albertii NBRC 107761 = DSM 17582]
MIQPISGPPPGQLPDRENSAGTQPLSSLQRTALESLMTKVTSLTQQQRAELWAGIKHDIGLPGDSPLLSRHFPAAEHNLTQRLLAAQKSYSARRLLAQLGEYLRLGNNRQAVTDYIRNNVGQTPLNQLSPEQLKTILNLLQEGKMVIPQPQQRQATDRPLLPAEHNTLKQLVTKLAAATGESSKQIWQSMLELSGVKDGELIPAKLFNHLVTWLQARQSLSQQNTPTLESLQMALKKPLDTNELAALSAYIEQKYGLSAQSVLSSVQAEDILNQLYQRRVKGIDPRDIQPLLNPFPPLMNTLQNMATRPSVWILLVAILVMLVWLVR